MPWVVTRHRPGQLDPDRVFKHLPGVKTDRQLAGGAIAHLDLYIVIFRQRSLADAEIGQVEAAFAEQKQGAHELLVALDL